MMKRFFLFALVNIFMVVTISLILNLLGIRPYLSANGLDYSSLMVFCLIWGMGGAFISLLLSKFMAKMMMGVKIVEGGEYASLVSTVHRLARDAGLEKMPEVGVYSSPELNAFATGPSRNNSLVAVSTGLLNSMERGEVEGVLGHEIGHIANGDMVTMTLLQGVMNAFVMFFARVVAFMISQALRSNSNDRDRSPNYFMQHMLVMVLEMIFGLLGMMVVASFSRWREFRADKAGARLAGTNHMVAALRRLQLNYERPAQADSGNASFSALKISSRNGFLALLSTHPPLEKRIEALQKGM